MKQDRLNSYMLVHCQKTVADTLDPPCDRQDVRKRKRTKEGAFGKFK